MVDCVIQPLIGVGPIKLGMPRDEVRRVMEQPPTSLPKRDAFYGSSFQVFYAGDQSTVEYIELSRESQVRALYRDLDVFATLADKVIAFISCDSAYDPSRRESGYSYIFPDLQLSVWRPVLPQDDQRGRFFSTIGIGRKGYYDVV